MRTLRTRLTPEAEDLSYQEKLSAETYALVDSGGGGGGQGE